MSSSGCRVQALTPARASDAPISFRKLRRPTGSQPLRRLLRELAVEVLLELRRLGEFFEAAPVGASPRLAVRAWREWAWMSFESFIAGYR